MAQCRFGYATILHAGLDEVFCKCAMALLADDGQEILAVVPSGLMVHDMVLGTVSVPAMCDDGEPSEVLNLPVDYISLPPTMLQSFDNTANDATDAILFSDSGEWPEGNKLLTLAPAGVFDLDGEEVTSLPAEEGGYSVLGDEDYHSASGMPALSGEASPLAQEQLSRVPYDVAGVPAFVPASSKASVSARRTGAGRGGGPAGKRTPTALFQDTMKDQLAAILEGQQRMLDAQTATNLRVATLEGAGRGSPLERPPGLGGFPSFALGGPPPGIPSGPSLSNFWSPPVQGSQPPALQQLRKAAGAPPFPGGATGQAGTSARTAAGVQARAHAAVRGMAPRAPPTPRPTTLPTDPPPTARRPTSNLPPAPAPDSGMSELAAALTAHTRALMASSRTPGHQDSGAMGLLATETPDTWSALDRLPGARGAASMELLRRSMMSDRPGVTARIRLNRNRALMGMTASEATQTSTRDFLIKEVPMGHNKTGAYLAFGLAEVFDLMEAGEWDAAEMTVGLLLCGVEQAAREQWRWHTGWLLTHLPEPPFHLVQRDADLSAVRPFAKLAEPAWTVSAMQLVTDAAKLKEAQKTTPPPKWGTQPPRETRPPKAGGKAPPPTKQE